MISPFRAARAGHADPQAPPPRATCWPVRRWLWVLGGVHATTKYGLDTAEAMRRRLGSGTGAPHVRTHVTTVATDGGHIRDTVERERGDAATPPHPLRGENQLRP